MIDTGGIGSRPRLGLQRRQRDGTRRAGDAARRRTVGQRRPRSLRQHVVGRRPRRGLDADGQRPPGCLLRLPRSGTAAHSALDLFFSKLELYGSMTQLHLSGEW